MNIGCSSCGNILTEEEFQVNTARRFIRGVNNQVTSNVSRCKKCWIAEGFGDWSGNGFVSKEQTSVPLQTNNNQIPYDNDPEDAKEMERIFVGTEEKRIVRDPISSTKIPDKVSSFGTKSIQQEKITHVNHNINLRGGPVAPTPNSNLYNLIDNIREDIRNLTAQIADKNDIINLEYKKELDNALKNGQISSEDYKDELILFISYVYLTYKRGVIDINQYNQVMNFPNEHEPSVRDYRIILERNITVNQWQS